jgi:hypothetical protein
VLAAAIALVVAGTAGAATFRVSVNGNGTQDLSAFGDPGPSSEQVSAASDVSGADPSGTIVGQTYTSGDVSSLTTFHGDVSQGCVLFQGNQAAVIGKLPADEQFTAFIDHNGNAHVVQWVDVVLQDNGTSGDLSAIGLLTVNEGTGNDQGANLCNGTTPLSSVTGFLVPASSGNYTLLYTDTRDDDTSKPDTNVSFIDAAGLPVAVTDAPDPQGVDVTVGAGTGTVRLDTCGGYEVDVVAGTDAIVTCNSVIVQVIQGTAQVVLGDGVATVSVPAGGKAEVSSDEASGFTVHNEGTTPLVVTVDGVQATVPAGQITSVQAWIFQGFSTPIANAPTLNTLKAGSAVPVKWRLLDPSGAPVRDLTSAFLVITGLNCASGAAIGPTQPASTVGPLQNLGDGYYQVNWKTTASLAGTCQTMHLAVGDGVTHDALFRFKS